jgi:predicted transcriptional regulator
MNPQRLMATPVSELMTEARLFSANEPVSRIIGFLKESKQYECLIDDGDRTCSVSVRDLLGLSHLDTKVYTLMHQVPRLNRNNNVGDAATLMYEYRARSMPIVEGRKLLGQITSPSIVAKLLEGEQQGKVSNIMTPEPVCVDASSLVVKARDLMQKKKFDQLPVLKDGHLEGVISSEQIVFNIIPLSNRDSKGNPRAGKYEERVENLVGEEVTTNEVTESLGEIYRNMVKASSNYSVIMNTGEVQGIVTFRDFMKMLLRSDGAGAIPMYIVGLPDDPFEAETSRRKFTTAVKQLERAYPWITEARAVIKMGETKSPKKKYEVNVFLFSPKQRYSYRVFSYELADAFDYVDSWVKGIASRAESRKKDKRHTRLRPE